MRQIAIVAVISTAALYGGGAVAEHQRACRDLLEFPACAAETCSRVRICSGSPMAVRNRHSARTGWFESRGRLLFHDPI